MDVFPELYDAQQTEEIQTGLDAGLDVDIYRSPDFHALQMREIRMGLENGIDASIYAKTEYDCFQMQQLRMGLEAGIDITAYANPNIETAQMNEIRKALVQGVDLRQYWDCPAPILQQLAQAKKRNLDIDSFISEGYSGLQLEQIRLALENEVDLLPYLDIGYKPEALREIRLGLEAEVDVSVYANNQYTAKQMKELRLGLMNRVDVKQYADPKYTFRQMQELRLGQEDGLDVRLFADEKIAPEEMRRIRQELSLSMIRSEQASLVRGRSESELTPEEIEQRDKQEQAALAILNSKDAYMKDVPEQEISAIAESAILQLGMEVTISDDEMSAYIIVPKSTHHTYTVGEILKKLNMENVVYGIDHDAIKELIETEMYDQYVCVAEGIQTRNGENGYYEYFFRTEIDRKPTIRPDGSVDYRHMQFYEYVRAGKKLAVYHPATEGTTGYTVTGTAMPARHGVEKPVLIGKNIHVEEDQITYVSNTNGIIELKGYEIIIDDLMVLDEVSYTTGNIEFEGSVHIRGNVGSGTIVEAQGDIIIDGNVESAIVRCGRNLLLKRGVLGGNHCSIEAQGEISGKFFENARIYAGGNITGNYILNCNTFCGGVITLSGKQGAIIGGRTHAMGGLDTQNLGNRVETSTYLGMGTTPEMRQRNGELKEAIAKVDAELGILNKAADQFKAKFSVEALSSIPMYVKIRQATEIKLRERMGYIGEQQALMAKMQELRKVKAFVKGEIFAGVTVVVDDMIWQAKHAKYIELQVSEDHIGMFDYTGKGGL